MKKILGLDLGTTSIGWAIVNEAETSEERSGIIRLGVRITPLSVDEKDKFEKGKTITTNADRTQKRGARRNLQRFKLRRKNLVKILKEAGFITDDSLLFEFGKNTTFETLRLRAKAVEEPITLEELARVLLAINKQRGYKSNRKTQDTKEKNTKNNEDGTLIDGIDTAQILYNEGITPGEYAYRILQKGQRGLPDFYLSDLRKEFSQIWNCQKTYYPLFLTDELFLKLRDENGKNTEAICTQAWELEGIKQKGKANEDIVEIYKWRTQALSQKLDLEKLAIVFKQINLQITNSSTLLGRISDNSKSLVFAHQTIGQYQMALLDANPMQSLKSQTFYRQDYENEFEKIWEKQAETHPELTQELKKKIRDTIIFYQRRLKSQKHLVSFCEFESEEKEVDTGNGKKKKVMFGLRCCPKSSPLFQNFKIWQTINNLRVTQDDKPRSLNEEEKQLLAKELNLKIKMTRKEAIKFLNTLQPDSKQNPIEYLNFEEIEGNTTMARFFKAMNTIAETKGGQKCDFPEDVYNGVMDKLKNFNALAEGKDLEKELAFRLWHLLYSAESDNSKTGDQHLVAKLKELLGLDEESAKVFAKIKFDGEYGSLSAKAIRKILPYMYKGLPYDEACAEAGYRHSKNSLTKEEIKNKELKEQLAPVQRDSLRNPVVEKILNQMVNVINALQAEYGKFDEIRVEMARELKKCSKERKEISDAINETTKENKEIKEILQKEFNISHVSHNDIIRYRLYKELESNGYKTLYSNTYIDKGRLFCKDFEIEHIIPKAKLFDDSFSNKTLETSAVNGEKKDSTAYDYIANTHDEEYVAQYKNKIDSLFKNKKISKTKHDKLLMTEKDIPTSFIERDLRNTQYIARKAMEMLGSIAKTVTPTTGAITNYLREDWQLVDVMKELNYDKYEKLGLTETIQDESGRCIKRIKNWTKRNDHRHHAVDALIIAFTKPAIIQFLNNKNARSDKSGRIYAIEKTHLYRDTKDHLRFNPPIKYHDKEPEKNLAIFRAEAKRQIELILVSFKAKNKVVTPHHVKQKGKTKDKTKLVTYLTPRGQLHNDTIYGRRIRYDENNNPKEILFTKRAIVDKDLKVSEVIDPCVRAILQKRLDEYGGKASKAFANLEKNPIWYNREKGIAIKRVIIKAKASEGTTIPMRSVRNRKGEIITDENGHTMPTAYVNPSNNHHVAIFRDENGNLQEHAVSFIEAVTRATLRYPIIDKDYNKENGWEFLFTMKKNEYFVFPDPSTGFNPAEIDLRDPKNYSVVSQHLYRVQKLASKYYVFRHHLETTVEENSSLKDTTWVRITSINNLKGFVKVRINNIGEIADIGEY